MLTIIGLFKSKTFWLNVILMVLAVINDVSFDGVIPVKFEAIIVSVLNILMRFLTDKPLSKK